MSPVGARGGSEDDGTLLEEARTSTSDALRDLVHAFVRAHPQTDEAYAQIQQHARELVTLLDAAPRRDRMALMQAARERHGGTFPVGIAAGGFNDRAVAGLANPTAVDITVEPGGDEVVAQVFFRKGFEGPPGRAHGGIVAATFDDVTGFIIGRIGQPAFTGELTVRYVGPTPIETPLVMTAQLDGQERRKLFISGELRTEDGTLTATCRAIYITIDPSVFAASPDPR
jgi:acyl-coenzyme A thioesterase PaaI-like protein